MTGNKNQWIKRNTNNDVQATYIARNLKKNPDTTDLVAYANLRWMVPLTMERYDDKTT